MQIECVTCFSLRMLTVWNSMYKIYRKCCNILELFKKTGAFVTIIKKYNLQSMEASQGGCKLASLNRNIQAQETKGAWT